jgi:hypothetical protein
MPPAPQTSRSPSPTPQPVQRKHKHTGVFMDAVEVPQSHPQVVLRRSQRQMNSLPTTKLATATAILSSSEELLPSAPLSMPPSLSASLVVCRAGLHRSQSLVISGEGPERSSTVSAAQRKRRQKKGRAASPPPLPLLLQRVRCRLSPRP